MGCYACEQGMVTEAKYGRDLGMAYLRGYMQALGAAKPVKALEALMREGTLCETHRAVAATISVGLQFHLAMPPREPADGTGG